MKSANERSDRRQKHQKPRRQSSVVQPLFRLSYCHTRHDLGFFFKCIQLFLCNPHTKAQCLLSLQNRVHTTVLREVSFSVILKRLWIAVPLCVSRFHLWFLNIQIMSNTSLRNSCCLESRTMWERQPLLMVFCLFLKKTTTGVMLYPNFF